MKIIVTENYDAMSHRTAQLLAAQILLKPDCVLGLATGSTPVGTYAQLIEQYQAGELDFSRVTTVNLDEYAGLAPEHEQSYRYFMQHNLFDHVNIRRENTHVPSGLAEDAAEECRAYGRMIARLGGIDMQLLGLGHNGHIGFNEPADVFPVHPHVVDLTENTIRANARFFGSESEVPHQALTMGVGDIMRARRILVAVSGEDKAEAVYRSFAGPVTPQVPASVLQLHNDVTVIGDRAALSKIL